MAGWEVRLVGDRLTPRLRRFKPHLTMELPKQVLPVGRRMEAHAKSIVPVRTGYLRSTIHFRPEGPFTFTFEATAPYASFVEFGTYRMNPRPYLRPALERFRYELQRAVERAVREVLL